MKNYPLVSVLIASYNGNKFIAEAIESVLNQTYSNFEIIISDDCSTDNTVEIVKLFASKDTRIKVYVNNVNLGDYPNRNKAVGYASGEYIKYLDHDDIMYKHCLEIMVDAMEKFPMAAFGIQSPMREDVFPFPFLMSSAEAFRAHYLKTGVFQSGPTGAIIKKTIFDINNGFSGERFLGDTEFWLRVASNHPVVIFQPSLIWWRTHEGQESKRQKEFYLPVVVRYKYDRFYIIANLSVVDQKLALIKLNRRFIVNSIEFFLRTSRKREVVMEFIKSGLTFLELLRAIFR